jgi:SnoaL-like domain
VSARLSPEQVVRKFFDCYTNGRPEEFDEVVAPDYVDYGHTPPGRGPAGARDDRDYALVRILAERQSRPCSSTGRLVLAASTSPVRYQPID